MACARVLSAIASVSDCHLPKGKSKLQGGGLPRAWHIGYGPTQDQSPRNCECCVHGNTVRSRMRGQAAEICPTSGQYGAKVDRSLGL